ncbi:helix-turn-helix domain-containing protein [Pseudochryseolinea flava]|uniref:AraC family transcriptional regulator n=1 Tax=Pseudochryseolinea flava TaxID=2059302 RepID=A0A364XUE2_9BACT|nr:helix-turn-helix domain-containing protein [Pseudochryseolinea flava]RAV97927.1 AraC family transcriptional regulator [Pseudochryseolinea flava]
MISRFDIDEALLMAKPERQHKFVLLFCRRGYLSIEIDQQHYSLGANQFLTITPKQFYRFLDTAGEGVVVEFTYDFFCKDDKSIELIYHNGLFCHFALNEIINIPNESVLKNVEFHLAQLHHELDAQQFEYEASLHAIVKLLLIEVSRCKIVQQQRPLYKPDAVFLHFLKIVRDTFSKRLTVKEYAAQMNITEQKLNELTKKNTGETTQQLINDLIVLEAKRLLNYEDMNVKQVALQLGFDDPHYFSRFFKKQTASRAKDHLRTLITK